MPAARMFSAANAEVRAMLERGAVGLLGN
jgi:hypothetical protein